MCISLGEYNGNYKYILLSAIFLMIYTIAFGMNYNNIFTDIKFFPLSKETEKKFKKNYFIRQIFCYLMTFFLSLILYKYEMNKSKRESNKIKSKKKKILKNKKKATK